MELARHDEPRLGAPSSALAQWIERSAIDDMLSVAHRMPSRPVPLRVHEAGVAGYAVPGLNSLWCNRIYIGGELGRVSLRALERALRRVTEQGVRDVLVHVAPDALEPELIAVLDNHGIARYHRAWIKLGRAPGALPSRSSPFAVREAGPADAAAFAQIVAQSFGLSAALTPILAGVVGRREWRVFLAYDAARPVATGALFLRDGLGHLGFGATLPEYRGRGAQPALLARRMHTAFELGCRYVFSETGEALAGQPNPSFDNMLELGMRPLERRENYARIGARWG